MCRWFVVSFVLVWNLAGDSCAGDMPHLVGALSAPEKIVFKGQKVFSERQLRDAVAMNSSLVIAGHPLADLADYLTLLNSQIEAGYHYAGFALVDVETIYDEATNAILVRVDEGMRYRYGEIQINGANNAVIEEGLRQYLMQPHPLSGTPAESSPTSPFKEFTNPFAAADESQAWKQGKPAQFHKHFQKIMEPLVRNYFKQLGYFDSTVSVAMEPEEDVSVTLTIHLSDLGPKAVLGEVEVFGCEKNSHEQVVAFLGLKEGMPLDSQVVADMRRKLQQSGRFLKQEIDVISPPFDDAPSTLKITVYEAEVTPPLDQPLSREQQIALRTAQWLDGFNQNSEDISLDVCWTPAAIDTGEVSETSTSRQQAYRAKIVLSPSKNEMLLNFRVQNPPRTTVFEVTCCLQPNALIVDCDQLNVRCEVPLPKRFYGAWTRCTVHPPGKSGETCNMMFGVEAKSDLNQSETMVRIRCDAAWTLQTLAKWADSSHLNDQRLTINTANMDVTIDADSGRISNFRFGDEQNGVKIEAAHGLYQAVAEVHQQTTREWPRILVNAKPFTSLMRQAANRIAPKAAEKSLVPPMIDRWVQQDRFRQLDELFHHEPVSDDANGFFYIPLGFEKSNGVRLPFQICVAAVDRVVPRTSWAASIGHEYIFARLGQSTYSDSMIRAMFNSDQAGPLAHLTGAYLLGSLNPLAKSEFSRRGLKHLAGRDFRADYEPFLNDQNPLGLMLKMSVELLRDCSEQELVELAGLVSTAVDDPDALAASITSLATDKQTAWYDAVPAVLDIVWRSLLRDHIEKLLVDCREAATTALSSMAAPAGETTVFGLKGDFKGDLLQIKSEERQQPPAE